MERLLHTDPDAVNPVVRQIANGAARFSAADAFKAEYRRAELAREIDRIFSEVDALVVPTTPTIYTIAAVQNDPLTLNSRLGTYTNFTNLADLAALALPADFRSDGLPAGITLIARAGRDHALAAYGKRWQRATGLPLGATGRAAEEGLGADAHRRRAAAGRTNCRRRRALDWPAAQSSAHDARSPPRGTLSHGSLLPAIRASQHDTAQARAREARTRPIDRSRPVGSARGSSRFVRCRNSRSASAWRTHSWTATQVKGFICEPYGLEGARERHRVRRLARVSRRFRRAAHLTRPVRTSGPRVRPSRGKRRPRSRRFEHPRPDDELLDDVEAAPFLDVREYPGPLAAHLQRVALHDLERRADVRREVDLVDDQEIGARDAGAALARNLLAAPRRR